MTDSALRSVEDWLNHLEALRPELIELGLGRTQKVAATLGLLESACPTITVAGTNGKGSVCAMLATVLRTAGYRVGVYTSPHLLRFQERIQIDGQLISDAELCSAFAAIEQARGDTPLTYFEFSTLAAVLVFRKAAVEVMILEVGLGGRLDAVNVFDSDCAVVTSIDLDHQSFLGDTREAIGFEKAGVYRTQRPAICADANPPQSLLKHAAEIGSDLWLIGRDFGYQFEPQQWSYWGRDWRRASLAWPALRGHYQLQNASTALAVLECLQQKLPVSMSDVRRGLLEVEWPGRFQVLAGRPTVILDVAHNPHAARALKQALDTMGYFPKTHAVVGMLTDKDLAGVLSCLAGAVDHWHFATLEGPRAATAEQLQNALNSSENSAISYAQYESPNAAFAQAYKQAADNDRIVVFGSFYTVSAVLAQTCSSDYRNLRDGR